MKIANKPELMLSKMIVTIDGPAGSGKSTTASMLASELNLAYLDTGAMYRAVTWDILENNINPEDQENVTRRARSLDLKLKDVDGMPLMFLDGELLGEKIRSQRVSAAVSPVSKHSGVRESLVRIQRSISERGGIVADGRDTGTTVFPFADVKIFLVADIESRAKRRMAQLEEMGLDGDIESIKTNLKERDHIDSSRETSPLCQAPGSITVDTSGLSIREQVDLIKKAVLKKAQDLSELYAWPGEKNINAKKPLIWAIASALVYSFYKIVFGLKRYGLENISFRENFIFASNHISYSDPPDNRIIG